MGYLMIGTLLVIGVLCRLYFLLKPSVKLAQTFKKAGRLEELYQMTDEVEALRLELLEVNDAFFHVTDRLDKRLDVLESMELSEKRPLKSRPQTSWKSSSPTDNPLPVFEVPASNTSSAQKVSHPAFDRVKGLHRIGYSDQEIAKELGIGITEVRLLISRLDEV